MTSAHRPKTLLPDAAWDKPTRFVSQSTTFVVLLVARLISAIYSGITDCDESEQPYIY